MSLTLITTLIGAGIIVFVLGVYSGMWLEARYWTESAENGETVEHRGRLYGVWEVPQ